MYWPMKQATSRSSPPYSTSSEGLGLDPSAYLHSFCYFSDSVDVSARAHIHIVLLRSLPHLRERLLHYRLQTLVNLLGTPVEMLEILDPFKIARADATRICQDVRYQSNAFLEENIIRLGRRGPIRAFRYEFRLYFACILIRDNIL